MEASRVLWAFAIVLPQLGWQKFATQIPLSVLRMSSGNFAIRNVWPCTLIRTVINMARCFSVHSIVTPTSLGEES